MNRPFKTNIFKLTIISINWAFLFCLLIVSERKLCTSQVMKNSSERSASVVSCLALWKGPFVNENGKNLVGILKECIYLLIVTMRGFMNMIT